LKPIEIPDYDLEVNQKKIGAWNRLEHVENAENKSNNPIFPELLLLYFMS